MSGLLALGSGEATAITIRTAAAAGSILVALAAAACGSEQAGRPIATVQGCADYGVHAIEDHVTVTSRPAACEGLSRTELNYAVAKAIYKVAGRQSPKPAWRKMAAEVAPRLAQLLTAPPASSSPDRGSTSLGSLPPSSPRHGDDVAMSIAALVAWIITAGSGAYVLGTWIVGAGIRRRSASLTGAPLSVVFGHFGLAAAGMALWIIYLATGWPAVAWIAVAMLLAVVGLGTALVTVGLPCHRDPAMAAGPAGARPPAVAAEARPPILGIAGHGLLAATTVLLVVLAAIGAGAG